MKNLESKREASVIEWNEFANSKKARILVGAATCGRAAGALDVMEEFKKQLAQAGLADKVEVVETACIGLCYVPVHGRICGRTGAAPGKYFLFGQ